MIKYAHIGTYTTIYKHNLNVVVIYAVLILKVRYENKYFAIYVSLCALIKSINYFRARLYNIETRVNFSWFVAWLPTFF